MISMSIDAASVTTWASGKRGNATFEKHEHIAEAIASCDAQTEFDMLDWKEFGRLVGVEILKKDGAAAALFAAGVLSSVARELPPIVAQQVADAMDRSTEDRIAMSAFVQHLAGVVMMRDESLAHELRRVSGNAVNYCPPFR